MAAPDDTAGQSAPWPDGDSPLQRAAPRDGFVLDLDGFEGPLDLLLELSRRHKIDLTRISILALAEQYLDFIEQAKSIELEIAADYLVMAAWLAYLKSRLLLPDMEEDEEPPAEELAARLAFQLKRLQAMREAGAQLMARNQLGRDVFERGAPEPLVVEVKREYADNLVDLLKAYADRRQRRAARETFTVKRAPALALKDARARLERLIGQLESWGRFDRWLETQYPEPANHNTVVASTFAASLELAREGLLELRQIKAFEPIYMRRAPNARDQQTATGGM